MFRTSLTSISLMKCGIGVEGITMLAEPMSGITTLETLEYAPCRHPTLLSFLALFGSC